MNSQDLKKFSSKILGINNLPDAPGVYYYLGGGKGQTLNTNSQGLTLGSRRKILYIGKATSLKDRVKSYFVQDILMRRSPLVAKMLEEADKVEFRQTDSVLEALILEANEIKKHQPVYNSKEKDDKSYNFIVLTKEDYPRVLIVRGRNLLSEKIKDLGFKIQESYGPFPNGGELKEALKIVRKIFPYRDKCKPGSERPCFNAQMGLCPGVCSGEISKSEYKKIIRDLKLFFEGKKDTIIKSLERQMNKLAREKKFEEANKIKKQIFALNHIQDIALIKQDLDSPSTGSTSLTTGTFGATGKMRVEAYDIAHISGTDAVGVMTVVEDGELAKSQYRKFKIRVDQNNDIKNLKEVISRRLGHPEWRFPNLIVVDGGKGQINAAKSVLKESGLEFIGVVSVVKDEHHRAREILGLNKSVKSRALDKVVLLANAEAHRFAIKYHRLLRSKGFRI